jgi:hypothetical protein
LLCLRSTPSRIISVASYGIHFFVREIYEACVSLVLLAAPGHLRLLLLLLSGILCIDAIHYLVFACIQLFRSTEHDTCDSGHRPKRDASCYPSPFNYYLTRFFYGCDNRCCGLWMFDHQFHDLFLKAGRAMPIGISLRSRDVANVRVEIQRLRISKFRRAPPSLSLPNQA